MGCHAMIASTSFFPNNVTMSGGAVAVTICVSFWRSSPYPFSVSALISKNVDVPTTAAIFLPLRSSTLARPASLRAPMAPSTAVATPVTLGGRARPQKGATSHSHARLSLRLHLRQVLERLLDLLGGVLVVLELAREKRLVGREVEMTVAAQVEDDRLPLALALAPERLVDGPAHGVGRLGCGQEALRPRELYGGVEGGDLWHGDRLDDLLVVELADQGRHAVVAETARVERRRNEGVAERVHLDERREADRVAKVVDVLALREARTGARLDGDDAELLPLAGELVGEEREGEAREVRAAADAADEDVGLRVRFLELLLHLEADDGLMHEDVVEHAPQRVLRVLARERAQPRPHAS